MIVTKDKRIKICPVNKVSDVVFDPSDWSIMNLSVDFEENDLVSQRLFSTPVANHLLLLLCRQKRKDRIKALSNIEAYERDFSFLDSICISYKKPSSCSNNGFLPISEHGFLFYKGVAPEAGRTQWFNPDLSNATNFWDLDSQPEEGDTFKTSYHQRFTWELNLLLMTLKGPLEYRSFIYGLPLSSSELRSLHLFCKKFNLTVQIFAPTIEEAKKMLLDINKGEVSNEK